MEIKRTTLPCYDEDAETIIQKYGYIIDLIKDTFPITIIDTNSKEELKEYLLTTVGELFDQAWNEYGNKSKVDNQIIYQYGIVD